MSECRVRERREGGREGGEQVKRKGSCSSLVSGIANNHPNFILESE